MVVVTNHLALCVF